MATARRYNMTDYVLSNRLILFNLRVGLTVLFWGLIVAVLALIIKGAVLT